MNFKPISFQVILLCVLALHIHKGLALRHLRVNDSEEYKLRRELLRDMDVMVRPVISCSDAVNVSFSLSVGSSMDLENKRQMLITNVWISQKWLNPFLVWNKENYGDIDRIHVSPAEIWVPDIVLYNNGDKQILQAGHTTMFKNWVVLHSNGTCTWVSPANVETRCNVEISSFPFDTQNCSLVFGSATYGSELLKIQPMHPRDKQLTERVTQDNGEWKIKRVYEEDVTMVTERRANSAQKYSLVKYTLEIERKPLYYVMLLILPCVLCTMLVLISFSIPPENGERIGFCSTIMISVSVYLLIMAGLLPEKSDTLPILGIYYSITLVEIALAIMATILVLRAYHSASDPPACFKALYRMRKPKRKKEIKSSNKWKMKKILTRNAVASDNTTAGSEADPTCQAPVPVDPEQKPVILTDDNQEITDDDNRKIWRSIAVMWDRIFFWLFLLMFLGSTGYLMKFRPVFTF